MSYLDVWFIRKWTACKVQKYIYIYICLSFELNVTCWRRKINGGIAPYINNHSSGWRRVISFSLFWDVTQRRLVVSYRRFGTTINPIFKGQASGLHTSSAWGYLLTPCSRVLLEKLTAFQLVKKFSTFYGNRRFIIAFTSVCHLPLSWSSLIHSPPPHTTFWTSILILSSHLRQGFPSGLFPSGFPTKTIYTPIHSPDNRHLKAVSLSDLRTGRLYPQEIFLLLIRVTCPAHLNHLDFITRTTLGEEYKSLSSSLCSFLHFSVTSSLLGSNILLSTLFSNTLNLRPCPIFSDEVSQPYKTTGRIKMWCFVKIPLFHWVSNPSYLTVYSLV